MSTFIRKKMILFVHAFICICIYHIISMLRFYDEHHDTPLAISCSKEYLPKSSYCEECYKNDYYYFCSNSEYCEHSLVECTGVTIQVQGNPIKFTPCDATYKVRIWHISKIVTQTPTPDLFTDNHFVSEFTISAQEDAGDLYELYGDVLQKYDTIKSLGAIDYEFRGPKEKQKYIDQYISKVKDILDYPKNKTKKIDAMENGHVHKRKKGYRHYK